MEKREKSSLSENLSEQLVPLHPLILSLIHISEPTRLGMISYAVFCLKKKDIRHEGMRIGGEKVLTEKVIEVKYPYTNEVVGTVPAGTAEHAAKAFKIASDYKPSLSRYERSQILQRTGEIIAERQDYLAKWLTLESVSYTHLTLPTTPYV